MRRRVFAVLLLSKIIALQQGRVVAALMAPPTDQPLLKAGFKRLVYGGDEFKDVPFSRDPRPFPAPRPHRCESAR